mgnify:CR=1 FL=1
MSYTFAQMVDEVRSNLAGYTLRQDRITNLSNTGGINTSELAIKIGNSENLAKGIIEIDDELIWVNTFDKANLTLNAIQGFGRGYGGTTPAPHSENSMVTLTQNYLPGGIQCCVCLNDLLERAISWAGATNAISIRIK